MDIILLFSLIAASVSAVFSLYRQFQMLQQNSYFPNRYYKWLKQSYSIQVALLAILFCLSSFLYAYSQKILQLVLLGICLIVRIIVCVKTHKKSIKKLVFTARIKRLFATAIICLAALLGVYLSASDKLWGEIASMLLFMLSIVSPALCLLAWCITFPIEKCISSYYIRDAKKKLKAVKGLKVIGITGSYGKTTTKFILNRILSEKFNTVCTPQSFNTPMGVVRTIRSQLRAQTQVFVCEMGAKKLGDIKEICDIVNPDFAIITSVGEQHLDTFGSQDNVFKTKFELADAIKDTNGKCFVNIESHALAEKLPEVDNKNIIPFGQNTAYFADNITYSAEGSVFDLNLNGEKIKVSTRLLGRHSVCDIVAAAALAHSLGVSADDIRFAISSLKPTEHRLELKTFQKGSLLIDDAYNSNPEGCLEAVRVLGEFGSMRKTIITPGLIELGDREYDCNFALGQEAAKYCDNIILVGKNRSKPIFDGVIKQGFNKENVYVVGSFKEAMDLYLKTVTEDSVVLIENDLPDNYLE